VIDRYSLRGNFSDESAADVGKIWPTRNEDGSDAGKGNIVVGHLLFDIEIVCRTKTFHDDVSTGSRGSLNREPAKRTDGHILTVTDRLLGECNTLIGGEQSRGLRGVMQHTNDDCSKHLKRLIDNVKVPEVHRVKASGDERNTHG
jgi:hypothetical protein